MYKISRIKPGNVKIILLILLKQMLYISIVFYIK